MTFPRFTSHRIYADRSGKQFSLAGLKQSENCGSVALLIVEIVENKRETNLEMKAEDVLEAINLRDPKLTSTNILN